MQATHNNGLVAFGNPSCVVEDKETTEMIVEKEDSREGRTVTNPSSIIRTTNDYGVGGFSVVNGPISFDDEESSREETNKKRKDNNTATQLYLYIYNIMVQYNTSTV
eukprot:scaffold16486_cov136-Amphora_coffeaeformis.AAC.1